MIRSKTSLITWPKKRPGHKFVSRFATCVAQRHGIDSTTLPFASALYTSYRNIDAVANNSSRLHNSKLLGDVVVKDKVNLEKEPQQESDEKNDTDKGSTQDIEPSKNDEPPKNEEPPENKEETENDNESEIKSQTDPNSPLGVSSVIGNGSVGIPPGVPPSNNNNSNNGDDGSSNRLESDAPPSKYSPLLAIPIKGRPPLPGRDFSLHLTDPDVIQSIRTIVDKKQEYFVVFHVKDTSEPDSDVIRTKEAIFDIGVRCKVVKHVDSTPFEIIAKPLERCRLTNLRAPDDKHDVSDEDFPTSYLSDLQVSYATVEPLSDEPYDKQSPDIKFLVDSLKALLGRVANMNPSIADITKEVEDPSKFADDVAAVVYAEPKKIQEILSALDVEKRLQLSLELLKVEVMAALIKENTIHNLSRKADDYQTKYLIKEYIKELQKRAGIVEGDDKKTRKFEERLKKLKLTDEAMEAYNSEKLKMESQNEHSSEVGVSEKYLDWLTSIPWGVFSKDSFNIKKSRKILDHDHYGLKDVKERILEFISLGKVSGKVDGKILCLSGPPGTGKTSIAKSIAESLNRNYVRLAMGGVQDVHEIKGHRRTYVGSIPGRIIVALKQAKTLNPLILIDEIDKLDLSRGGGAAAAFLEILDPEQNNAFVDNYIDVKVDLSKVLFVCTANHLGNIPAPLRDRMEIINVDGYTNNEKFEIVKRHLIPEAARKAGLNSNQVKIEDDAVRRLIDKYCRESGLRNVKKFITRIFSKSSLKIVEKIEDEEIETLVEPENVDKEPDHGESVTEVATSETKQHANNEDEVIKVSIPDHVKLNITVDTLKDYVGPEIYTKDRVYETLPPGVATGLSYSSSGNGDALYIESILTDSIGSGLGRAGIHVTGSLKDVMKESASIAYSFSKSYMSKTFPENRFFEAADIHVHCPDGAIPKDGPSAGISFVSSLISLAINKSIPGNIAMTGEITVTGRVLPVGGLREKILGAKRNVCDTVIFPKDIENELQEIPEEIKQGIKFVPVEWYQDVFDTIFPDISVKEANQVWKEEFIKFDNKKSSGKSKAVNK